MSVCHHTMLECLCVVTLCKFVSLSVFHHTSGGQIGERDSVNEANKYVSEANRYVGEVNRYVGEARKLPAGARIWACRALKF